MLGGAACAACVAATATGCTPAKLPGPAMTHLAAPSSSSVAAPLLNLAGLSAQQLLSRAKLLAEEAPDLHIQGTGQDGGETLSLDVSFGAAGSSGTIAIDSLPVTLLSRGGTTWFKAAPSYWKVLAGSRAEAVVSLINGRWVEVDPDDRNYADFAALANRDELLDQFLTPHGPVAKAGEAVVAGVRCIVLTRGAGQRLYVSAADDRPILSKGTAGAPSNLGFDYAPVTIPDAPPAGQALDSASLGG